MINKLINFLFSIILRVASEPPHSSMPCLYYLRWRVCVVLFYAAAKIIAKKSYESPTDSMLNSREFFSKNMGRVNNVASILVDDTSRDCYYKMIDFRCNSDRTNFPPVSRIEYFDDEYFTYSDNEVYVDCGAYYGDTVMQFKNVVKKHKGNFAKIVAFEPGEERYDILKSAHKDVIAIKAGVWSKDDTLMFSNGSASEIVEEIPTGRGGTISIPVRSIDNCPECEGVTLLKMDIEGAEMDALIGAKNTIATYKPKLAICIYHSNEDMIRIAEWIHEHFPEYRLFVKQHAKYIINETVLYGFVGK